MIRLFEVKHKGERMSEATVIHNSVSHFFSKMHSGHKYAGRDGLGASCGSHYHAVKSC